MEMRREQKSRKESVIPKPLKGMPLRFDYKYLNSEQDHVDIKKITNDLQILLASKTKDAFRIGEALMIAKNKLPPKLFVPWVETELRLKRHGAQKYMRAIEVFGNKSSQLRHLPCGVLYELTLPSTPQHFIDAIISGTWNPSVNELRIAKGMHKRKEQEPIMIHSEQARSREVTIQDLASQLAHMQQQIAAMPPQVEEVVKYVTPSEILEENEKLRQEATKWHSEWEKIVEDRRIAIEQYNILEERYIKVVQERDVLMENWNAVSKNNKSMVGKISSLSSLVERFHEEYLQIKKANALVIDSTVVAKQNGES